MSEMTTEERAEKALRKIDGPLITVYSDDRDRWLEVLTKIITEALTASEERAQRAERERDEAVIANHGLMAQIKFNTEQHHALLDSWIRQQEKDEATIAALTPLAEEGRKSFVARRDTLQMVADKTYRPDTQPLIYAEMEKAACEGEVRIDQLSGNPSEWFEITDKGRERLAYLRGLVGEEKAECQQ